MADDVIAPLLAAISSSEEVRWSPEWFDLQTHQRRGDWGSLRKSCAKILGAKSKDLRIALWWVEANTQLEGPRGLADGIRLLCGLWPHFGNSEVPDEDLANAVAAALETNLLQVRLADCWFTFTTVINSRSDLELEVEVQREASRIPHRWIALLPQIETVEASLKGLGSAIGSLSTEAFDGVRNTLADMRRTLSGWTQTPARPPEEKQFEPPVPQASGREIDYRIYLMVEGVTGESTTAHHGRWIEALSYRQSVKCSTASEGTPEPIFEIEKYVDRASPSLYRAVHTGRRFETLIVDVCRDTEAAERFLRIEMGDATISEMRQAAESSSGRRLPVETIAFDYRRIQWTYTQLLPEDAVPLGNTSSTWTRAVIPAGR